MLPRLPPLPFSLVTPCVPSPLAGSLIPWSPLPVHVHGKARVSGGGGKEGRGGALWLRNSDLIKLKELGRVFFEVFAQNRQLLVAMLV